MRSPSIRKSRGAERALVRAQAALEETRDRFVELYDFAPNGYLTLDQNGIVRQCNLTVAAFIGKPREAIEGFPMLGLISSEDRMRSTTTSCAGAERQPTRMSSASSRSARLTARGGCSYCAGPTIALPSRHTSS